MSTKAIDPNVKLQALDLSREFPRSPRTKLGGYVLAARALDKCRAELAGSQGEYHYGCPMDSMFLDFSGITAKDFKKAVAEGRSDDEMDRWIREHAKNGSKEEVVQWNNELRDKRLSEMDVELQVFLEDYIDEFIPKDRVIYHWFDVYDIEEGRL